MRVRTLDDGRVAVSMGKARFPAGEGREALRVNGSSVELAEVSMGNPHAVIEHPAPADVVRTLGPRDRGGRRASRTAPTWSSCAPRARRS